MTLDAQGAILDKVVAAIRDALYIPNQAITLATRLVDDLELDSLDLITTFLDMEEDFGVEFPHDAPARFRVVSDIVVWLNNCKLPKRSELRLVA